VFNDPRHLERMLAISGGVRRIPVIVDGDAVRIGFEGGT
jgi:hypothetical protein